MANSATLPHIVVTLMESFGSNALYLDDKDDFDLLGAFRAHFENGLAPKLPSEARSDFTFKRFLSSTDGTAPSFANLFLISPTHSVASSLHKKKYLPFTPFGVYKNAGYDVIYITPGNNAWQGFGAYLLNIGVDSAYDMSYITQLYKDSASSKGGWGIGDEYAFNLAFEILQNAKKPTFIAILTTSNHPPHKIPEHYTPPKFNLTQERLDFFNSDKISDITRSLGAFNYASNSFGEFISKIKDSTLKDSVIVAGSGDHLLRDFKKGKAGFAALDHSVPLYLYIPPHIARRLDFNPATLGSHKDIFPTLYALSLSSGQFVSLGGSNLFDKTAKHFALNASLRIDESGIYRNDGDGVAYKIDNGFIISLEDSLPNESKDFFKLHSELFWWQINYRLFSND